MQNKEHTSHGYAVNTSMGSCPDWQLFQRSLTHTLPHRDQGMIDSTVAYTYSLPPCAQNEDVIGLLNHSEQSKDCHDGPHHSMPTSGSTLVSHAMADLSPVNRPFEPYSYQRQRINVLSFDGAHNAMVNHCDNQGPVPQYGINEQVPHVSNFGSSCNVVPFTAFVSTVPGPTFSSIASSAMPIERTAMSHHFRPAASLSTGVKLDFALEGDGKSQIDQQMAAFSFSSGSSETSPAETPATLRISSSRRSRSRRTRGPYVAPNPRPCQRCKRSHIRCAVVPDAPARLCHMCKKKGLAACA